MRHIKKILFITLSNIGDVVLTLPALDAVRAAFPESKITVVVGPRPQELFRDNPAISRTIVFDKHARFREKVKLFRQLQKERFDVVIDLRNSFFGAWLTAHYKTSPFIHAPRSVLHMRQRHLYALRQAVSRLTMPQEAPRESLCIRREDELSVSAILKEQKLGERDRIIAVAAGARSHTKRWAREKFVELIQRISKEFPAKIVLVGDKEDIPTAAFIVEHAGVPVIDLTGKTTLAQLASLLKKSQLLVANDSAVVHLASYLGLPVVALFGPSNEMKYGPWSEKSRVVKKDIVCRPCEKAQCRLQTLECLSLIKVEDVLRQVREVLASSHKDIPFGDASLSSAARTSPSGTPRCARQQGHKDNFKRILIVRTDRIGDVVLSTPVIKALRDAYPDAYSAMMVSPSTRDIVEGNPYLDQVITYDKDGKHKSWMQSMKFARAIKKKGFDLALVLHPTNRVHLITFFAGIPRRVGYDRKLGILLTDRIPHAKQYGERHEVEYTLDLVRYLGIEPQDTHLFMPIRPESEQWVDELFAKKGINHKDTVTAIHPCASCPSKVWPGERFAEVADRLITEYRCKVLFVAGPKDADRVKKVMGHMRQEAINLAGMLSLSQLASVLRRCRLFISCDSGPVHIATGVGTPVISIFGRNQKGLSPTRWGPVGSRDKSIHKDVGCIECLAHDCNKSFVCLKAIAVDDVLGATKAVLGG